MKGYLDDIRPLSHGGAGAPKKPAPRKRVVKKQPVEEMETVVEEQERIVDMKVERVYEPEIKAPGMTPPRRPYTPIVEPESREPMGGEGHWGKIVAWVGLGMVAVALIIYGLSFVFRGATVTVTPKSVSGSVSLTLSATQDPTAPIEYQVMTLPDSVSKAVTATTSSIQSTKATGQIIIYNFQTTSQSLVAQTRFADPNGNVFRLQSPVTIPKETVVGGVKTPGQVTATFAADVAGPSGNIPLSDFTVVAFKGTAKSKLVYGRGATPFTGGATGSMYSLTDQQYQDTITTLSAMLPAKLRSEAIKQVPPGYVLLQDTLNFVPDVNTNTPSQTASVTVTYSGKMSGVLVRQDELEAAYLNAIASDQSLTPSQVTFLGEDALVFHTTTDTTTVPPPTTVSFTVTGNVTAVWKVDTDAIRQALIGTTRADFDTHMQTFTPVKDADLVLRPFWMNKLPTNVAHIKVVVANPTQ